jgi:CBS domain-containing protein
MDCFKKITVAEIMNHTALCIRAEARISDAIEVLTNSTQDWFPVVDQSGACRGIVTLLDLLRSCFPLQYGDDYPDLSALFAEKVGELASDELMAVSAQDKISDVVLLMVKRQEQCLPVLEDSRYLGIIHLREIVKLMS